MYVDSKGSIYVGETVAASVASVECHTHTTSSFEHANHMTHIRMACHVNPKLNRHPTILITNQVCQLNMGDALILGGTLKLLKDMVGKAKITVLSFNPDIDTERCPVRVLGMLGASLKSAPALLLLLLRALLWRAIKTLHQDGSWLLDHPILQQYMNSDVIIVRGGDTLTSDYGLASLASHLTSILLAESLKKPIVLLGHTVGPFGILKYLSTFIFDRVNLIILRETLSREHLRLNRSKTRVAVTVDMSLHLEICENRTVKRALLEEGFHEGGKTVGIAVSQLASSFMKHPKDLRIQQETFVTLMARLIDYIVNNLDVNVLLTPTVLGPGRNDDRIISRLIYDMVARKDRVKVIVQEYRPEEMTAIIGSCEVFIGCRMHACVAALANCVPTVALGYGHKFDGVIGETFGQSDFIVKVADLDWNLLLSKVNQVWQERNQIRERLQAKNRDLDTKKNQNLILLKDFFGSLGIATAV